MERRTKVSRACDYCKKRKFKCSGVPPCNLCSKKHVECIFSIVDRRTTKAKSTTISTSISATTPINTTNSKIIKPSYSTSSTTTKPDILPEYIPKNLQPLLSFPLKKDDINEPTVKSSSETSSITQENGSASGLANNVGKNLRLLYDKDGKLRYIGESSPLSLAYEARKIFKAISGESDFTNDPDNVNIIDGIAHVRPAKVLPLPRRDHALIMINFFEANINSTWYIYNKRWLIEKLNEAFNEPLKTSPERMAAFHLIFSLGLMFAEKMNHPIIHEIGVESVNFFESGFELIRNILDDGRVWMSETTRRSSSWMMLGNAIRNAQALGLHRKAVNESFPDTEYVIHRKKLWKTLYTCDRISSILLGRPLTISDYDWDDFPDMEEPDQSQPNDISNICLNESVKISRILGHIVQNFYQNGIVNLLRAEKIAIDLKKWSINLPSIIQIDKVLDDHGQSPDDGFKVTKSDNYSILLVHMLQLYGIMLLGKPFFMYLLFKRNPTNCGTDKQEKVLKNFCAATIKASVLTIQVAHIFIQHNPQRTESYITANCCCKAGLILGLAILYRQTNPDYEKDEFSIGALLQQLQIARSILYFYSSTSQISKRLHSILDRLVRAVQPDVEAGGPSLPIPTPFQQGMTPSNVDSPPFRNQFDSPYNMPFENIMNFQQFFVPSATNSVTSDDHPQSLNATRLDEFMYNIGMNELLLEGKNDIK
ncbi:FGR27 Filamentous growth regulator 27 [Candida maltosa Xu316]